jgi:DNA helicase-2/ATP-dependent DNA helicase PcrA
METGTPNAQQRLAIEHGFDTPGPLLVIAGAGSGKTSTLAYRVSRIVMNGIDPARILLLTFSRRAAIEMTSRAQKIVSAEGGRGDTKLPWSGTFHSVGARLLREYAGSIGLDARFTILDREDAADLMNLLRNEQELSTGERRFPQKGTCLSIYSRVVNGSRSLAEVLDTDFSWCTPWEEQLRGLFAAYVEAKQRQVVLDYDDLLLYWARMMAVREIAADVGSRFDHVLVDEYQDTNKLQESILLALKPNGSGVMVVGDDAQAIYSFRSATVRNILDFPNRFYPPARAITLDRNYRSSQPLLNASNAVIGLARERLAKNLWTDRVDGEKPALVAVKDDTDQARYVADQVLAARESGTDLKSQAVLFRASHHSGALEMELARRDIPYVKFGGLKFLEAAHIKDVIAILRVAENPRDRIAIFRTLLLLPGIGPKRAGALADKMASAPAPFDELLDHEPPKAAGAAWQSFTDMMRNFSFTIASWPGDIGRIREWYRPYLEERYDDAHNRLMDVEQLEEIAHGYPSRQKFLTDLALDPPAATSDQPGPPSQDDDYLILSTIHSAKGQEWTNVFVLHVVDGCIPSDLGVGSRDELEEERRLLYVGMTRAKNQLHLIVPQRFYVGQQAARGDRHVYGNRSRFIPDSLLDLFDLRTYPLAKSGELGFSPLTTKRVDLGKDLMNMWR